MKPEEIEQLIKSRLADADVYVEGEDGTHFSALVISQRFIGLSRVKRQQLVYAAVNSHIMDGRLHALSIKTMTPEEWQAIEKD